MNKPDPRLHYPQRAQCFDGFDEEDGQDIQHIDHRMLGKFMPPGVEPLDDFFDVLSLQEDIRKDDPRLGSRTVFTLRASYERIRELERGLVLAGQTHSDLDQEIERLKSKLNVTFQHDNQPATLRVTQVVPGPGSWAGPDALMIQVDRTTRFGAPDTRTYRYALVEDESGHVASTPAARSMTILEHLGQRFGVQVNPKGFDPLEAKNAIESWHSTYTTLDEEILKICGVEPHDDTTTLDAVRSLAEHTAQLSRENVRLREERDAAKRGDYVHPRRYVRALEDTLLAIGRLLGHKTLPAQGGLVPYDKQMTNYCSRLLQAVRTRMNNAKTKKGTH